VIAKLNDDLDLIHRRAGGYAVYPETDFALHGVADWINHASSKNPNRDGVTASVVYQKCGMR